MCLSLPCIELGKPLVFAYCVFPEDSNEDLFWFPSGEQLLCEASTVLKYVQEDSCQRGIYGKLVCTDFKIAFLGDDESALDNDVCASCIWLSWGEQCSCVSIIFFLSSAITLTPSPPPTHIKHKGQKSSLLYCSLSLGISLQG